MRQLTPFCQLLGFAIIELGIPFESRLSLPAHADSFALARREKEENNHNPPNSDLETNPRPKGILLKNAPQLALQFCRALLSTRILSWHQSILSSIVTTFSNAPLNSHNRALFGSFRPFPLPDSYLSIKILGSNSLAIQSPLAMDAPLAEFFLGQVCRPLPNPPCWHPPRFLNLSVFLSVWAAAPPLSRAAVTLPKVARVASG